MKRYIRSNYDPSPKFNSNGRGPHFDSYLDMHLYNLKDKLSEGSRYVKDIHPGLLVFTEFPDTETVRVYVADRDTENNWRNSQKQFTHTESFDNVSEDAFNELLTFSYWIKEGRRKGVPLEELYDYIISRSYENKRSGYYHREKPEALEDLIANVKDYKELYSILNKAQTIQKTNDIEHMKDWNRVYSMPYESDTLFDQYYDISDYVKEWSNNDGIDYDSIRALADSILKDIKREIK